MAHSGFLSNEFLYCLSSLLQAHWLTSCFSVSQALFYLQVFAFVVLSPYMCFLWCFSCLAPPTDLKSELKVTLENPSWLCCLLCFYFELVCELSHSVLSDSLWPAGSSVHGDMPSKNTGEGCMPSSRGSFQPRDRTQVSCIAGGFFTVWATRDALTSTLFSIKSLYFS